MSDNKTKKFLVVDIVHRSYDLYEKDEFFEDGGFYSVLDDLLRNNGIVGNPEKPGIYEDEKIKELIVKMAAILAEFRRENPSLFHDDAFIEFMEESETLGSKILIPKERLAELFNEE